MMKQTDEQLFQKAQKGHKSSFDELYFRYERPLYTFIYRYLKSREQSEEVFHDVFIKVIKSTDIDFNSGSFKGWVYMICRNLCIDKYRKGQRHPATETFDDQIAHELFTDSVEEKDFFKNIKKRGLSLPNPFNQLFSLKLLGLKNSEISQSLNIPVGTVKSRTNKMVSMLKQEVNHEE